MPVIFQLEDQLISQIAAGEVIESPASVVKELLENAIDARAKNIAIAIKGGGLGLIQVCDDGIGMEKEDLPLAISRHATSKLKKLTDLEKILTLGFRGEALSSIFSVAKVKILSSRGKEACVLKSVLAQKTKFIIEPAARAKGTTVEVASLFYNVPVRKKFQKSQTFLNTQIQRVVYNLALAHPRIGFLLTLDGRKVFQTMYSETSFERAFQDTAQQILGDCRQYRWISYQEKDSFEQVHLMGYVSQPEFAKKNRSAQRLIVNGRPVSSVLISQAVKDGFATALAEDLFPAFILHLNIFPRLIDVNVHPQKKEIRFKDGFYLKEKIKQAVFNSFYSTNFDSVCFQQEHQQESDKNFKQSKNISNQQLDQELNSFFQTSQTGSLLSKDNKNSSVKAFEQTSIAKESVNSGDLDSESLNKDLLQTLKQESEEENQLFFNEETKKYKAYALVGFYYFMPAWPFQKEGVAIVDLKRVLSAVLFQQMLANVKEQETFTQRLLIPKLIDLSLEEIKTVEDQQQIFTELGLVFRKIGSKTMALDSFPSFVDEERLSEFFLQILEELKTFGSSTAQEDFRKKKMARCLHLFAKRRDKTFSLQEADALMQRFFQLKTPALTPMGEKVAIFLDKKEINKMF